MDTNKHDEGKIRPSLVPTSAIRYISEVRGYGLTKYPETGENGWKEVGRERFLDALMRHLISYIEDPEATDAESGLPTIAHIATNAAFLCWYDEQQRQENYIPEWIKGISKLADEITASLISEANDKSTKGDNK